MDQYAQVIDRIAPHSQLLRAWPLKGGISAGMTALEIQHPDGKTQKLVLRRPGVSVLSRSPQAVGDEFKLLQIAQSLQFAAPTPILLDTSGTIFSTPYLVTGYVEGRMEFAPAHPQVYAEQMAAHLAQIHAVDGTHPELSFLLKQPGVLDAVIGRRPAAVTPLLDEKRIRGALEHAWPGLKHNPPCLLHGDYWPGNILWQGEQLAAVIDWEDACIGDPLSDLAIARLDLLWIIGQDAMHTFTRHYQSRVAVEPSSLPYWDLCAALRLSRLVGADLDGWAAYFHPYGRPDITAGSIREQVGTFVNLALEKLAQR